MKLDIKHIGGRDLSVDFLCTCPSDLFKGTEIEHLMNERIRLSGYNDNYFFNTVNAEPRQFKCKCGKEYTQQWFNEGYVEVNEIT
ncbi:hypothetical protein [Bacillus infantis]|uniref:hypothetical protein n=1 Tax=Bacillus infantis TaxID=324767 RepID=UPI003CF8D5FC